MHDPAVVQRADFRQRGDGVVEDGPLRRFVEQPHITTLGVIAVALDHRQRRAIEPLRQFAATAAISQLAKFSWYTNMPISSHRSI